MALSFELETVSTLYTVLYINLQVLSYMCSCVFTLAMTIKPARTKLKLKKLWLKESWFKLLRWVETSMAPHDWKWNDLRSRQVLYDTTWYELQYIIIAITNHQEEPGLLWSPSQCTFSKLVLRSLYAYAPSLVITPSHWHLVAFHSHQQHTLAFGFRWEAWFLLATAASNITSLMCCLCLHSWY
jgi:hypothetical protein